MLILSFSVGALLVAGGIVLCFAPLNGFMEIGQIIGIAMALFSVTGLVQCVINRSFRADFFLSLLGLFAAVFILHDPLMQFMTDAFVLYLAAVWLVIGGASQLILAFNCRKKLLSRWWLILIAGILNLLLGLFTFLYPLFGMIALGLMIAFYFIDTGLAMLLCGIAFLRA